MKTRFDVLFVRKAKHRTNAAVSLRVQQLHQLLQIARPNLRVGIWELPRNRWQSMAPERSRIVVVSKYLLDKNSNGTLSRLIAGATVVLDPIDIEAIEQSWLQRADGLLTPNYSSIEDFQVKAPNAMVRHVPHHVDLRIPQKNSQQISFALGYFGEPYNGAHLEQLSHILDAVPTKTSDDRNISWQHKLLSFSAHYAARSLDVSYSHKPPMKLALAAHVRSNIVTVRSEPDVEWYLGRDYPYLAEDASIDAVTDAIAKARDTFGSAVWKDALQVMDDVRRLHSLHEVCGTLGRVFDSFFDLRH